GHPRSPRPFHRTGHVLPIGRGEAHSDTEVGQFGVRIMTAMELGDRFGIALAGLCLHQNAFLKRAFENNLQGNEKRAAAVAMPVREVSRHNFRVVDMYRHLRIPWQRTVDRIEQQVLMETMTGWPHAIQLELQILVAIEPRFHCPAPRSESGKTNIAWQRVEAQSPAKRPGLASLVCEPHRCPVRAQLLKTYCREPVVLLFGF